MKYLVPMVNCFLINSNTKFELCANVKYSAQNVENFNFFIMENLNSIPFYLDLSTTKNSENVLKVKYKSDEYIFIKPIRNLNSNIVSFKFSNSIVSVGLINKLIISINGIVLVDENVSDINYSHFDIVGELCIIHFKGKRNYVAILNESELCCATYYDEYNKNENEQLFMCRLFDGLNHGKVFQIKDKQFSSYLVYLDDNELNLKPQFVGNIFLDCVIAENFKYCNLMFVDDLKQEKAESIKDFFPQFDFYFAISESEFILIKKNTLAGIYKFEYMENKISNIIQLDCQ